MTRRAASREGARALAALPRRRRGRRAVLLLLVVLLQGWQVRGRGRNRGSNRRGERRRGRDRTLACERGRGGRDIRYDEDAGARGRRRGSASTSTRRTSSKRTSTTRTSTSRKPPRRPTPARRARRTSRRTPRRTGTASGPGPRPRRPGPRRSPRAAPAPVAETEDERADDAEEDAEEDEEDEEVDDAAALEAMEARLAELEAEREAAEAAERAASAASAPAAAPPPLDDIEEEDLPAGGDGGEPTPFARLERSSPRATTTTTRLRWRRRRLPRRLGWSRRRRSVAVCPAMSVSSDNTRWVGFEDMPQRLREQRSGPEVRVARSHGNAHVTRPGGYWQAARFNKVERPSRSKLPKNFGRGSGEGTLLVLAAASTSTIASG